MGSALAGVFHRSADAVGESRRIPGLRHSLDRYELADRCIASALSHGRRANLLGDRDAALRRRPGED
ncbi:hypothetical protein M444_34400 [Streptomyces sp. Mg1]|nr:hypothetical protein M444_34400 [Streptomyces sp. Mg1]